MSARRPARLGPGPGGRRARGPVVRALALVALAAATGCTILNAVDEGRVGVERCDDGLDNDGNQRVDCRDQACFDAPACTVEVSLDACTDGRDNDGDGTFDCQAAACRSWPPCLEADTPSCTDGRDNDKDGVTDCDDAACALLPACLSRARLVRTPLCPALRPALAFVDEFDDIDGGRWATFSTSSRDRPRIVDGGLDPNGVDNFWSSGVASVAELGVGQRQPFRLELDVAAQPGCDRRGPSGATCLLRLSVDTRRQWGDGLPFGHELLAMHLQVVVDGPDGVPELLALAYYHTDPGIGPVGELRLPWTAEQTYRVVIALDEARGEAVYTVDEVEVGRATVLGLEPLGRVVLQSQLDRLRGPGAMIARRLAVSAERERPAVGCEGLSRGASLLPTTYCDATSPYNTGLDVPAVVRRPAGDYVMLFAASFALNRQSVALATSLDGRSFEVVSPDPELLEPEGLLTPVGNFELARARALVVNEDEARLEAWHFISRPGAAPVPWLSTAPLDAPTRWTKQGTLTATGALPLGRGGPHVLAAVADASLVRVGREYRAYYVGTSPRGRPAVFALRSPDGRVFSALSPDPVLEPRPDSFDTDGIRAVAATAHAGGVLLGYVGTAFASGAAIGLAYAADGLHFERHVDNPLIVPEPGHLDALGIRSLALAVEGPTLRLWYVGDSEGLTCSNPALSVPTRAMLGLAELTPSDRR